MPMQHLEDCFYDELRDVLSAEKQLAQALPKMAKKASSETLKKCFEQHLEETKKQIERLEKVFQTLERAPRAKKCEAMAGLIEEGKEVMEEDAEPAVRDALLIASAQKAEHYEIATYGTLCMWAEQLGYTQAKKLLGETLEEEKATDEKLSQVATEVNQAAMAEH